MTIRIPVAAMLLLALSRAAYGDDPALNVAANRGQIYLGESVLLTVKVSGSEKLEPDLSAIANCTVKLLGSHSDSRFSITIINGRMQRESFTGRIFSYELTPSAAGPFRAGPVRLNVDGRVISETGPAIEVSGVETQERVLITVSASRESVLVDEPFTITLAVAIRRLQGRFADADPMDPGDPPLLNVPFLENQPIQGLESPNVVEILQKHLLQRPDQPGFAVNKYTVRADPFVSMFNFDDVARERPAGFQFDRRVVERGGQSYFEYSLALTYTPREEASHTFGPVLFKGKAAIGLDANGRMVGRPVFAVGPAFTVRVVPPPEQNRPPCFIGAIGTNLAVKASLDAQTCNVGDPLTLTLSVGGNISMDNLRPPALGEQPALTKEFKLYDDTVQTLKKDGGRQFTYTIRPRRSGTLEVPPIEVAFYDVSRSAYRVERTAPIPLRVNEAMTVVPDTVIADVTNRAANRAVSTERKAPPAAPMTMNPAGADQQSILRVPRQAFLAAAGPAFWLLVATAQQIRRRAILHAQSHKRHRAAHRALAALRNAARAAPGDPAAARLQMCAALRRYLADRMDASAEALTPEDARNLLRSRGVSEDALNRYVAVLERGFNASYAQSLAVPFDPVADCKAAQEALEQMEMEIEAEGRRKAPDETESL